MATYDPRQTFKAQQEAYGRASGVTQQQEAKKAKKAKTSFASGSTYDEVPQVITTSPVKGLFSRSSDTKQEEKSLDRKIYEYFMDAGAKVDEPEQNVYALPVYERSMFKVPAVTEVTTQGIKDPFDPFSADTYKFGGYDDTREAAPQVTQTQDPDIQDLRKGLMSAPTMEQPSTPDALTGIPRGLALGNATPSKSYLIKDGDTLSQIAKDNNTTVKAILDLNSEIEDKNVIDAGARIEIPLSDTQAALRGGLNREKNNEGVQTTDSGEILTDATDPDSQFYQSGVPMDQRKFEPELGADAQSVTGYDDVPQTVTGLMSKTNIVKEDFDTSEVSADDVAYESVKKVQKRLNDLGYTTLIGNLAVDGVLGKGTARQLRKFQATAGLPPTAVEGQPVDKATQKALKDNRYNNKEGKDLKAPVTALQDGMFEIIKAPIAKIESGGEVAKGRDPYLVAGGDGGAYDGKYQLGRKAKNTIKNRRVKDPNGTLDADGNVIMVDVFTAAEKAKLNHPSNRADFRNDKELQEKAFRQLIDFNHGELTRNSAKYRAMDQGNQLSVLGYAHNQGAEAALEWLTTAVVGTDAFGTRGDKYSQAITEIFTKDDMLG